MYQNVITEQIDGVLFVYFNCEGKVNVFNKQLMEELSDIVDNISDVEGVVFASKKSTFIAGADINEFFPLFEAPDSEVVELISKGQTVFNNIEDLPIPTVAWINGAAMGGGLEIALACTARATNDSDSIQLALPETKLGILPAWGGTTRLPRLIGADNAIDLICSGRSVRPKEALKLGLIDAIVTGGEDSLVSMVKNLTSEISSRRSKKTGPVKLNMIESMMVFKFAASQVKKKAGPHYPAPIKALEVIEQCRKMKRDEALSYEQTAFAELIKTDVAKHLVNIFMNEKKLKAKADKYAKGVELPSKVTILGAGTMGAGIAFNLANKAKVKVTLYDPVEEQLEKSRKSNRSYLMNKVNKGYITLEQVDEVMDLISESSSLEEAVSQANVVIEAIPENFELKHSTFQSLSELVSSDTVIATNTSTFKVDALKESLSSDLRSNLGGLHFFNPVGKMPLVEIVSGKETSDKTIGALANIVLAMGKTPVICKDCSGFVVNRMLMPYLIEFDQMVSDGVDFEHIDKVMKEYGWPMGPAELCDLVGLDIAYHGALSMAEEYDYVKIPEHSVCEKLFESNTLGQKTGAGFYSWRGTKKGGKFANTGSEKPSPVAVQERLMSVMEKEADRLLEEGIVEDPYELNMALIFGAGFPPWRGGLVL